MYEDPILKKYAELIMSKNGTFKHVYIGDPVVIPNVHFPCLILAKAATRAAAIDNANDGHEIEINCTVITDIRESLTEDSNIVPGVASLYNIMEARDAETLELKDTSVLGILRKHAEMDTARNLRTDLGTVTRVEYGLVPGRRAKESWSIEASLTFIANFIQRR